MMKYFKNLQLQTKTNKISAPTMVTRRPDQDSSEFANVPIPQSDLKSVGRCEDVLKDMKHASEVWQLVL